MPQRFTFPGSDEDDLRTSIVPVSTISEKSEDLVQRLAKRGIVIAEREIREKKILRISPHFYNDENEIERLIQALMD
ncbi:MAG: hypothetical protein ACRECH_18525 [Nitrososphaerales archaeon]